MVAERPSADTEGVGESQEAYQVRQYRRAHSQEGSTSVEYGLLAAFVGMVFVLAGPMLVDAFVVVLNAILDGMVGS